MAAGAPFRERLLRTWRRGVLRELMKAIKGRRRPVLIMGVIGVLSLMVVLWFAGAGFFDNRVPGKSLRGGSVGKIKIGGSASAIPLMKIIAGEYRRQNPGVEVEFLLETHSAGGVASAFEGGADIGVLSRTLTPEEAQYNMRFLHLANDILVFATHPSVTINNLSSRQIRDIYSGAVTNWRKVGGPNAVVAVLDRPEHTSPKIAVRELLFGKELLVSSQAISLERPWQMNESLRTVPYSIGYTSLADIIRENLSVNVLSIDGVSPNQANVESQKYMYFRPFGFVVGAAPSKDTMRLVNFIYSEEGSKIIENSGYAPVVMTLVIGTIPERSVLKQEERYRPLVRYLYERLGSRVRIRLKHLPSYEQVVDEFMAGKVNAAFFGSLTYAMAQSKVGAIAIARPEKDGVSQYRGLILTRKDSGIKGWEDLRGRSFAMIEATTAGEIFLKLNLKRHGVNSPEKFLGQIVYVGSHDDAILKVLNREVDAAAAKDLIFYKLAQEIPRLKEEIRILATGFPAPENALTIRKDTDIKCYNCHAQQGNKRGSAAGYHKGGWDNLETSLRQALLDLDKTEAGRAILEQFGADRFVGTTDEDYRELYESIRELGIDLSRY